jgi:multiple sugar transport system permease protein
MRSPGKNLLVVTGILFVVIGIFAIASGILTRAEVWEPGSVLERFGTPNELRTSLRELQRDESISTFEFLRRAAFTYYGNWSSRSDMSNTSLVVWILCGIIYIAVGVLGILWSGNLKKSRVLTFVGLGALYVFALSAFVFGSHMLAPLGSFIRYTSLNSALDSAILATLVEALFSVVQIAVVLLPLIIPALYIAGAKKNQSSVSLDDWGYIFISPFGIIFLAFIAYPIFNTFYMSMTNATITGGRWIIEWVGFANFRELFGNVMFREAVINTWRLWIFNFIPQMVLALTLAAMFTSTTYKLKGTGFFKAMYYLPNLMMPVTIAALFNVYMNLHGPLNQFLVGVLGVWTEGRDFMMFVTDMRVVVVFLQTWMWFGQTAIVLVAGMTSISPTFYESAMIDGANQVRMFFSITLPLLKPILLFVLVTSLVGGLGMFDIPLLFAGNQYGNPDNSVLTVNMFMNVRRSFQGGFQFGSAASVSVVLFFMSSFVALIVFSAFKTRDDEYYARKQAKRAEKEMAKARRAAGL